MRIIMRKKMNVAIMTIVIALSVALLFAGCEKFGGDKDNAVKVGVNLSLTGSSPYWSTQVKRGLEVAADEEMKKNNPNGKLQVIYEDNQGQAKNAISIFQKLATVDKVATIVTAHTYIAQPQRPLAGQYQIPLMATIVSAVDFAKENAWTFYDSPTHDEITPPVAEYAVKSLNTKKAATIVVNDDYGKDGANLFKEYFEKAGGTITGQETFGNTDKDVRAQLTKLLKSKPEVLYTVCREDVCVIIVKQARELGFKGYITGVNAFDTPGVWKGLGAEGEGIIFGNVAGLADSPEFDAAFEKRFGEKPDWIALYGYTVGKYLYPIVLENKGDREKIRQALSTLDITGARGNLKMSADRKVVNKGVVYIRKGGRNVNAASQS